MTMTSPAPLAEFLPSAPGAALETSALRAAPGEPTLPRTADFAALLQDAGLAAPPLVAVEAARAAEEAPEDPDAIETPLPSVIDGILFLAVVQPGVVNEKAATDAVTPAASRAPIDVAVGDKRRGDARLADGGASLEAPADDVAPGAGAGATPSAWRAATRSTSDPETFDAALDAKRDAGSSDRSIRAVLDGTPTAAITSSTAPPRPVSEAPNVTNDSPATPTRGVEPTSSLSPSGSTSAPQPVTVTIETPIHDASWRVDAATRIASLVTRGIEHAEVRVTPPDLGPVELRIDVRGNEATLAIVAVQPTTRDALEQALPMLRDMLAQQGLSLGQATVADGRAQSESSGNGPSTRSDAFAEARGIDESAGSRPVRQGIARGLIDVFA